MTIGTVTREAAKIAADILQAEMELDEQHCLLGDQKWDIPADKGLFVVVFAQASPPYGGANFIDNDPTSSTYGKEVQQASVLHDVRVEIMSFDNSARVRATEVGLAFNSFFAQQLSEKYNISIGRTQPAVNATDSEPSGRLQKFVTHTNMTALHQKIKGQNPEYFDKFNGAEADASANPPTIAAQE